jgi:hypothetical protein
VKSPEEPPKKTVYVGVRLEPTRLALLRRICTIRGEDISDFVRRSIAAELVRLKYLGPESGQALGLPEQEG